MRRGEVCQRVGVVLFQLGAPDGPEAIEPFLANLFRDPDILPLPMSRLGREALARLFAARRAAAVRKHYDRIGGKSPLGELTARQARALEAELGRSFPARVVVAMRYWHPLTLAAIAELESFRPREIVLLPLYPQYSSTTTGSSLKEWWRHYPHREGVAVHEIREYHRHPGYIDAVGERIGEGLARFRRSNGHAQGLPAGVHLLFSAHSVPLSVIERGDSYQAQIEATVKAVVERIDRRNLYSLCYQSQTGPGRWLGPSLVEAFETIAAAGTDNVLVIPISFVSDHLETLYEIDIDARARAESFGIRHFETMPGLNDSPSFIAALADLVRSKLAEKGGAA